jgi:hypothetical protein
LLLGPDDPGANRLHGGRDRSAIYFVTCPVVEKGRGKTGPCAPS